MKKFTWLMALMLILFCGFLSACSDGDGSSGAPLSVAVNGAGTVTSDPSGIDCGEDCDARFPLNSSVTLTATADADAAFTGWSGDGCTGTEPCTLVMDRSYDVVATFESAAPNEVLNRVVTFSTGIFDDGAAEISAYDPQTRRLFVVNGAESAIDVWDMDGATSRTGRRSADRLFQIDVTPYGKAANSVAFHDGILAAAVENNDAQANGSVVFFDADGTHLNSVEAGALPDMVTFTPDGTRVLAANEGEPNDDYTNDPEGSVSIVDISGGVANATVVTAGFRQFNAQADALRNAGVRIYGPGASVAQDLEPEYIAVSADSATAWVALQENNALAVVDVNAGRVTDIFPFGYKDHNVSGAGLDASNRDGRINIQNWPVYGMYQPDAMAAFQAGGRTYLITANEGDSRDYDGYSEETRVADLTLDETVFTDAATLQQDENLGRLKTTLALGDIDNDGDFDNIFAYGARSFSIWAPTDAGLELVFDSGDDIEQITAQIIPELFNAGNDENEFDDRSDDKGPEPEAVAVGEIDGRMYAFIGLERVGGVLIYDVTDPGQPAFIKYLNNRDPDGDPEAGTAGDLGPEGMLFIGAADSPSGRPMLAVANEVSGTTTVYEIGASEDFALTLMHVNDTHSHIEADEKSLYFDGVDTDLPMGGFARLATKVAEVRASRENSLFLHAGDVVQGTLYFTTYAGEAEFNFLNMMGCDGMVVGNHEFDKGPETLSTFCDMAAFPIIASNVDASADPHLSGRISTHFLKDIGGETIGVFGLVTPETPGISSPGDLVVFHDPIGTAREKVAEFEALGVNKIILLSHMGYDEDIALANAVDGVDIIVGGHSHTLLGNLADIGLTSQGDYPTRIYKDSGDVCIVQAWEHAKALGVLDAAFDRKGRLTRCAGSPVVLVGDEFVQDDEEVDAAARQRILEIIETHPGVDVVAEDADALAMLAPYKAGVDAMQNEVVATVGEDLLHERVPGTTDESGEVLTEGSYMAAVVAESFYWKLNETGLDVDMTLIGAGGVRIDVPAGDFTVGTAYEVLPFGNTLVVIELTGADIKQAVEDAIERILNIHNGAFPYVAGMRYTVDVTKPYGERVVSVEVLNDEGEWEPINDTQIYRLGTNNYTAGGGDGYAVFEAATDQYDTGFVDAEVLMEYAQTQGTLYRPSTTGVTYITESASEDIVIKIIETTDVHGSLFPYDFIEDETVSHSLAQVFTYVKQERNAAGQDVILLDNGDILQGQPIINYFNYEVDLNTREHIVAGVMNYMGYDAGAVGNHDVEPGHPVYDAVAGQFDFPWLSANAVTPDGGTYFTPYTVIEKQGVKIAVLGLTTPGVPNWLAESLWSGMEFEDMVASASYWAPYILEHEQPDLLVGLFHSGFDYTYNGQDENTPKNENAAQLVALNVPEFDIIFIGHDHMNRNEYVNGVLILGGDDAAVSAPAATVSFTWNDAEGRYDKAISGEVVDATAFEADADMLARFDAEIQEVKAYVSEQIGAFTRSVTSRNAMFGDSAFVDLIHEMQLETVAAELDPQGADISFCAPLQFDKTIDAGPVYVRDMYKLYKYENTLYLMELTGREILDYLEYNYANWFNQMESDADHLIHFTDEPVYDASTDTWSYDTATRYYNYDSAAGIIYDVDASQPEGSRVNVISMADGGAFYEDAVYKVAINSYRGNGGGGHVTTGAGVDDPESRIIARTERDLRYYLMAAIREAGTVTPEAFGNWRILPEAWAEAGMIRDYDIFYGNPTFAVISDPHLYDIGLGVTGSAFEAVLFSDRKLLAESEAILAAAIERITADPSVDFIIVPGDLTKDGERVNHELFAQYLSGLEDAGLPVFVAPGNHDVNNPGAESYSGETATQIETVTPESFAQIYGDFGYDEAVERHEGSLSYLAEPVPGLWVLALDSCDYQDNMALGHSVTSGRISNGVLNWALEKLAQAEEQNKQVFGFMHHNMIEHFTGQATADISKDYVIEDWENVSRTLAEAGLNLVFTGHFHSQDVTLKTWENDGETVHLTDVETGSLVTWPNPFRVVSLDVGNGLTIDSRRIEAINFDTGGMAFQDYSQAFVESLLYGQVTAMLTLPPDMGGYGLAEEEAEPIVPYGVEALMNHNAGDEILSADMAAAVTEFMADENPAVQGLGQLAFSLCTDLAPADNELSMDLDAGDYQ